MNKIMIIGNSARDAELEMKGDKAFARISLAVTRKYDREATDWFNCVAFGGLAENVIAKYVKKGTKVAIVGRLEFSEYEKDGIKQKHHSVIVEDVELLGGKSDNEITGQEKIVPVDDDSLPF